jgi:hypothetical protein
VEVKVMKLWLNPIQKFAEDLEIRKFMETLATCLMNSLLLRFRFLRDASAMDFKVLPSVATLLDMRYNSVMLMPAHAALLSAAKSFIVNMVSLEP